MLEKIKTIAAMSTEEKKIKELSEEELGQVNGGTVIINQFAKMYDVSVSLDKAVLFRQEVISAEAKSGR